MSVSSPPGRHRVKKLSRSIQALYSANQDLGSNEDLSFSRTQTCIQRREQGQIQILGARRQSIKDLKMASGSHRPTTAFYLVGIFVMHILVDNATYLCVFKLVHNECCLTLLEASVFVQLYPFIFYNSLIQLITLRICLLINTTLTIHHPKIKQILLFQFLIRFYQFIFNI